MILIPHIIAASDTKGGARPSRRSEGFAGKIRYIADEQIHKISAIMKGRTQKALELFKIHGSNTDAEAEADTDAKKSGI
ncbi:hypothetical protein M378DRAFT_18068 [Amanita muscaria Koide BX008]|uniref:Uncharacterized protein n=1 Tax=Amanita muscaria (strain Koide BX008) TaxID=946122 RepID=A0A0C2RY90_AMAMK|nr:hypothetical protein M378DRAFT_18068 [Amanita muscaria Koide BX008]